MSQRTILVCNRCGQEVTQGKFLFCKMKVLKKTSIMGFGPYKYASEEVDLCHDCAKDFGAFMTGSEATP